MRKSKRLLGLFLVLTLSVTAFFAFDAPNDRYFQIVKNLDIFASLFKEVNAYYVDEVNPNEMMKTGIDAMLNSLDPYTNYIPEDAIEEYRTMTTGRYGGIGALVGHRNGENVVIMPHEGYPAYRAGMKIGDRIVAINGYEIEGRSSDEISQLLKGQAGTPVTLKVRRFGEDDLMEFTLIREKIQIDNVTYSGMVADNVGLVRLTDFTMGASREVKNAIEELKKQGAESVILDLRSNPGGLLNEAINICNLFVDRGQEVVSTRGKVTEWNKTYRTLNPSFDTEIPVAVLINSGSASASEIVAGVLQDYDRGILIGQKSFGKGLVQATRPLTYNSQLKVTTAKYYIPSGRCIQALDYTHRRPDGSVGKIADSLKVEFFTQNGRSVFDGGGVDPDVALAGQRLAPVTISLLRNNLIFDYATRYYYLHDKIAPASNFHLSNSEYKDFMQWLSDKSFDHRSETEQELAQLIATAKEERYYDEISSQLSALENRLSHNKEADLEKFKDEIIAELEQEIAAHYYLEIGRVESSFTHDQEVQEAIRVLNQPEEIDQLLARQN
ncbi:MAG TPA: peptidase S41 [Cytophagales bacterium]|nr:peptidase S41 [Cytophagales bacterium]HAP64698.1 peptidase S41 [Cytophagales bacterium]